MGTLLMTKQKPFILYLVRVCYEETNIVLYNVLIKFTLYNASLYSMDAVCTMSIIV